VTTVWVSIIAATFGVRFRPSPARISADLLGFGNGLLTLRFVDLGG